MRDAPSRRALVILSPTPLDEIVATWDDDSAQHEPFLICTRCGTKLCSVEEGDTFEVLLRTVSDHTCEAPDA